MFPLNNSNSSSVSFCVGSQSALSYGIYLLVLLHAVVVVVMVYIMLMLTLTKRCIFLEVRWVQSDKLLWPFVTNLNTIPFLLNGN